MKQNKTNRFAALLLALCMAVCCALPALAAPAASAAHQMPFTVIPPCDPFLKLVT